MNGGAGTDTLHIKDTVGVMNTTRAAATVTNVENMVVETAGRLGEVTAAGGKQVNTYTMPASVANVSQVLRFTIADDANGGTDKTNSVTYGATSVNYAHDDSEPDANATAVAQAFNIAAGATVAYVGSAPTALVDIDGTVPTGFVATNTAVVSSDVTASVKPGMSIRDAVSGGVFEMTERVITKVTYASSKTFIEFNGAALTADIASQAFTVGGGATAVSVFGPANGTPNTIQISDLKGTTTAITRQATDGTEGDVVTISYDGKSGTYVVGADATATGTNFVAAINGLAGYTAAVNTTGSVAVTAKTAGTALPAITFSGATGNIPSVTATTANGTAATDAKTYDISGISLEKFTASATDVISLKAKATTTLDLAGTGAITVNGGGGDSKLIGAGAISVGSDTAVANDFTSLSIKGTTAAVVDRSALTSAGAVTVGSDLTTVSLEGTGTQTASTLEGKGITTVSLKNTSADVTVTNATVGGHAATLNVSGTTGVAGTSGVYINNTATSLAVNSNAATLATTTNALGGITAGEATTMTVSGAKGINVGTLTAAKLTTLNITGSGGVTADVSSVGGSTTATAISTVDTTGATNVVSAANGTTANAITLGTKTAFVGGAGVDFVTVSDAHTKSVALGAGNDKVVFANGATTVDQTGAITGGDGTDTLEFATFANAVSASANSNLAKKVTGFETLSLVGAAGATSTIAVNNLNDNGANAINSIVVAAAPTHAVTMSGLLGNSKVQFNAGQTNNVAMTLSLADASGTSDSISVLLGKGGSSNDSAARLSPSSTANALVVNGIETVNIQANPGATATSGTNSTAAIKKLASDAATSVVLTGTAIEIAGVDLTKVVTIDGSALTGDRATTDPKGLTIAGNLAVGSTVNGSAHVDTITLGNVGSSYNGGAGKDTFIIGGASNLLSSSVYNKIDGGDGVDTISFVADAALTLADADFKEIRNVEKISITPLNGGNAAARAISVTGTAEYDTAFAAGGSEVTLTNADAAVTFAGSTFTGNQKLTVTSAAATTNHINLATGTGNDTIAVTASAATAALNVSSAGGNNTVTVAANEITTGAITLSTGAGNDNVAVSATKLTTGTHSFATGAGNDYLKLTVANTIVASGGTTPAITINGGAGKDVIEFSGIDADDAVFFTVTVAAGQSTIADYDSIIGFNLGTQTSGSTVASVLLDFAGTAAVAAATSGSLSVSGYTVQQLTYAISGGVLSFSGTSAESLSLATKIALVDSLVTTNLATAAFEHAGNTYVYNENSTGDSLVELVGITGITSLITSGTTAAAINIA